MTAQNRDKHGISLVDLTAKNKQDKESIFNWIVLVPKYAFFKIRSCMKMINFFNLSIFWGGRVHRVPSLTYHGNVFNVITGLFLIKVNPILSNKNQLFPTTIDSDFYQIENFQQIFFQLSDPTSSLPSPPTSMTSSLTSFGFTQEQVNITLSRGVTLTVDQ